MASRDFTRRHTSRLLTIRRAAPFVLAGIVVSVPAAAQNHPFPTPAHYGQGFVPSTATAAKVQSAYDTWLANELKNDCGNGYYRVDNGNGDGSTFSEGQGYGMVISAYLGDKTAFDGLWSFAQKNFNQQKLMGWHVTCGGSTTSDGGSSSATDGDTDIGFGLVVAAAQWGGTYLQQAKDYLSVLKSIDFTTCSPSGRNVATAGSWQSSAACTTSGGGSNTSYWMPAYYRVFAQLTGDSFWSKTADDVVALYGLAADPTTGIIVNEVDQEGVAVPGQTYDYNSCRIPWRATLDYLWFGTAAVQTAMTKLTNWANGVAISNIVDGYQANGTPTGQYKGLNAFVGGFTVGAMTNSQSIVDSFSSYFTSIADDNGTYYGTSLRVLYLLELSGNEWNPLNVTGDGGSGMGGGGDSGTQPVGIEDGGGIASGSSGGDSSSGGQGSSGGGSGGDGGSGNAEAPPGGSGGACGCHAVPASSGAGAVVAVAALVGIACRRRRRGCP
jgi:MYXO-CTERM domain-containing protein